MVKNEQIKRTIEEMGITHAVLIDDKVNEDQGAIENILNGNFDEPDFNIREFVEDLGYTIEQLKETYPLPSLFLTKINEQFPGILKSEISELLEILYQLFEHGNIQLFESVPQNLEINSNTILFLDYKLDGSQVTSEQLTNLLAKEATSDTIPRCIVFISNDDFFTVTGNRYNMLDYKERTAYFRKIREQHASKNYKNTVYDYISKRKLTTIDNSYDELNKVIQNLYGSRKFFELLNCIEEILYKSSDAVLGQFHLLNARSIQDMIREKVIEEGISAPTFLIQWISRHISKKVEQNEETGQRINTILSEINEWTESYYETQEDMVLREILQSEMWDVTVSDRHLAVDFGDIFEIDYNNEKKRAILLTQTCTLAIRNNGKRSGRVAMLALENKDKLGRQSGITLDDWNGEKITFDLDETISIPISFLDLTTLNQDGRAVLKWVAGNPTFTYPTKALWSDGYKKMMKSFIEGLADKLISNPMGIMYQIDETYMPVKNESTAQNFSFEFPIKRLSRLDQQYTLYVLQAAQAWWGRIGLPVNVNFMDDYQKTEGDINAHGSVYQGSFFIKRRLNDIVDIGISLLDFSRVLELIYEDDATSIEQLLPVLTRPELANLHFSSGQKVLSLKLIKTGVDLLAKHNIYIRLTSEDPCVVDLKVGKISKVVLEDQDVTSNIIEYKTDPAGNIKLRVKRSFLEEKELLDLIDHLSNKTSIVDGYGEVVSLSSRQDRKFQYILEKNILKIHVSRDIFQFESAVTVE